jgi:phage regulator Rha-like protein
MTDLHKFSDVSGKIDRAILIIRGLKVMIDSDLAELFGVRTKRLNEQVKRNINRFPKDFMFQLTTKEKQELVANCDHLERLKHSGTNPYAFTEHGTIMLANVLNTPTAVETSVLIVRAFVKLRELLSTHKDLERKILELESKYDKQFELIFKAIRELMHQDQLDKNRPRIGYKIGKGK